MLNHVNRTIYLLILHIGIWSRQIDLQFNRSPVFFLIYIYTSSLNVIWHKYSRNIFLIRYFSNIYDNYLFLSYWHKSISPWIIRFKIPYDSSNLNLGIFIAFICQTCKLFKLLIHLRKLRKTSSVSPNLKSENSFY